MLGNEDKGHQPGKKIWLLKLKTVRSLVGEGVGQSGQERDVSGKEDKWEGLVGSGEGK